MKIIIHKMGNKFPLPLLRYIIPRWLNQFSYKKSKMKIYKWLWFGFVFKVKGANQ